MKFELYMLVIIGNECVVVKQGRRICGTGSALANVEVVQDKCYFEVRIQSSGKILGVLPIYKMMPDSFLEPRREGPMISGLSVC